MFAGCTNTSGVSRVWNPCPSINPIQLFGSQNTIFNCKNNIIESSKNKEKVNPEAPISNTSSLLDKKYCPILVLEVVVNSGLTVFLK